jgi:3-oxoacyl-[acyl-carrier protein] reductase
MGIGRAITKGLAAEGVQVAAVARRTRLLEELGSEIGRGQGARPFLITQDIMAADAATKLRDAALAGLGHVDILVNCAGGSRPLSLDATEDEWQEAITLNFTRQRQITHAVLPQMIERRWGRIINITGKSEPDRLNAAFAAKAAMHAWAKGLSRDVGKYGVTVNSIPPGRIMSEQIRRNYPEEYRKSHAAAEIPAGAYGEPEDLAVLAVFLASPLAHYISGAVIPVDGGLRRYAF